MTYKSPAMHALEDHIRQVELTHQYVETARGLREMVYGRTLTLHSTESPPGGVKHAGASLVMTDNTKRELLEWLAQKYEDKAADRAVCCGLGGLDIRQACKV